MLAKLPLFSLLVGLWLVINGILHDFFILKQHNGPYNRDLLRLLMDGHILITCGLVLIFLYSPLKENSSWAYILAIVATSSILVYCGMIFPFLKSMVTILLNVFLLALIIVRYLSR